MRKLCDIDQRKIPFFSGISIWNAKVKREKNFYKLARQHPAGSKHFFGFKFFTTYMRHVVFVFIKSTLKEEVQSLLRQKLRCNKNLKYLYRNVFSTEV